MFSEILRTKEYWYGVYRSAVRPLILEKVQRTSSDLDDKFLEAFDFVVDKLCGVKANDGIVPSEESS